MFATGCHNGVDPFELVSLWSGSPSPVSSSATVQPSSPMTQTPRADPDADLADHQVFELHEALHAHRQELVEALRRSTEATADAGGCPVDIIDTATTDREQHRARALLLHQRKELMEVDAALRRMQLGTYGVCVATGEPIGFPRLAARPWARRCVAAADPRRD